MVFSKLLPAYHIPTTLSPALQQACEARLKKPVQQQSPREEYKQQEAFVPLIHTLGKQPINMSQVGFAGLGALLFTAAFSLANQDSLTYYQPIPAKQATGLQLQDTLGIKTLVVKHENDKLDLGTSHFYYTTEKNGVQQHWHQYQNPENSQYVRTQHARAFDANKDAPLYRPPEAPPVLSGGIQQEVFDTAMTSTWTDEHGIEWSVSHTWETWDVVNPNNNEVGAMFSEESSPKLNHLSLQWQDATQADTRHLLTFSIEDNIQHTVIKAGQAQEPTVTALADVTQLGILLPNGFNLATLQLTKPKSLEKQITQATFEEEIQKPETRHALEDYLKQYFPKLPSIQSVFNELNTIINNKLLVKDVHRQNQVLLWVNQAILQDIQAAMLPNLAEQIPLDWHYLSVKNQPLQEVTTKTLIHKALGILPVGLAAFTVAGLAVLGVHQCQERHKNQAILNALGQAKHPEEITIAQAKKHYLLA